MMRKQLVSLAVLATALFGAAHAQVPAGSGSARAAVPAADVSLYFAVARSQMETATPDNDMNWSRNDRSGTVRYGAWAVTPAGGCRDFFLRELRPVPRAPVIGNICESEPAGAGKTETPAPQPGATRVVEGQTTFDLKRLDYAAAAGPNGEPRNEQPAPPRRTGATRGITAPPPSPPPPSPPPPVVTPPPAPSPQGPSGSGGIAREIQVRAKLVNLLRADPRLDRAGGHAVILFRNVPAAQARNRAACQAVLLNFDETTYAATRVGVEKEEDGTVVAIRPIYWPHNPAVAAGTGDRCTQRLRQYDYGRANAILDKIERPGAGPFLVVSRDDQRQAAIIEMTGLTTAQIPNMVVYFRDRFSQQRDIWTPAANTPAERRRGLLLVFGDGFTQNLLSAISLFSASSARVASGCIGDARDTRSCGSQ